MFLLPSAPSGIAKQLTEFTSRARPLRTIFIHVCKAKPERQGPKYLNQTSHHATDIMDTTNVPGVWLQGLWKPEEGAPAVLRVGDAGPQLCTGIARVSAAGPAGPDAPSAEPCPARLPEPGASGPAGHLAAPPHLPRPLLHPNPGAVQLWPVKTGSPPEDSKVGGSFEMTKMNIAE